jgi:hypothetical protein
MVQILKNQLVQSRLVNHYLCKTAHSHHIAISLLFLWFLTRPLATVVMHNCVRWSKAGNIAWFATCMCHLLRDSGS